MIINEDNQFNLDYTDVINNVNLKDLTRFIISLNTESWVPKGYWQYKISTKSKSTRPVYSGQISWAVFSYLVSNKIIFIEDKYYLTNPSRTKKYLARNSYHNPIDKQLYQPILERLVDNGWLDEIDSGINSNFNTNTYNLGKVIERNAKLKYLING